MHFFFKIKVYRVFSLEAILMSTHNVPVDTRIHIAFSIIFHQIPGIYSKLLWVIWSKEKLRLSP